MCSKFKIKQVILVIMFLVFFSTPMTVSAQGFWDFLTLGNFYSFIADGAGDPNDDKKKKGPSTPVAQPQTPDLPAGEYCRNELGELGPCQIAK